MEQKYLVAQNMDQEIYKKYQNSIEWMKKFSQQKESIIALIPKSSDIEFVQKNKKALNELAALDQQLVKLIGVEENRKLFNEVIERFLLTNFVQSLLAINNKKVDKNEEFNKMMDLINKDLQNISFKVNFTYIKNCIFKLDK